MPSRITKNALKALTNQIWSKVPSERAENQEQKKKPVLFTQVFHQKQESSSDAASASSKCSNEQPIKKQNYAPKDDVSKEENENETNDTNEDESKAS